ncbi:MAG: hypothetical protein IRY89_15785 [Pseudolabrys sp.]|nr:hypothetical protein [Pseudolabrys sp.]
MSGAWSWLFAALAAGGVVMLRAAFLRAAAGAGVDHYYWLIAAAAYRESKRLPAVIRGKYLLEDERQFYPPAFGWLLSRLPPSWLAGRGPAALMQATDAATLLLLLAFAAARGVDPPSAAVLVLVYGTTPILVSYNCQLTSRALGNLFFTASVLALVCASGRPSGEPLFVVWFAAAAVATALTVLAHKMTTQLMLALWPLWPLALDDGRAAFVVPAGIAIAIALTGPRFAAQQWRAHADIVGFWNRHRDLLGAHAFAHSPVYGDPARVGDTAFHGPGWKSWLARAARAFGYCPLMWLAPATLLVAPRPPAWVLAWTLGTAGVVLLTLYVPLLRRFGGGHLYVFNAAAPTALWWADVLAHAGAGALAVFVLGCGVTAAALLQAYRLRRANRARRDRGFEELVRHLRALPRGRLAVFPLTAADELACRTPHAVLWGGHSYGFRLLEPIFPVVREPLAAVLRRYRCDWLAFDADYLAGCEHRVMAELAGGRVARFGRWVLVTLAAVAAEGAASDPASDPAARDRGGGAHVLMRAALPRG